MKKRNIALLVAGIALAAVFGVASAGIGFFVSGLAPIVKLVLFDLAILSAGLGIFDLVTLSSSLVTGYVKRKLAKKKEADSFAQLVLDQEMLTNDNQNQNQLSKDLAKSMEYNADNKDPGYLGDKYGYGETNEQTMLKNQQQGYGVSSAFAKRFNTKRQRKIDRKVKKINNSIKEKSTNSSTNMSGPYEYNSVIHINSINKDVIDHRTGAKLYSKDNLEEFKELVESNESIKSRYKDKKNRRNFGHVVSIQGAKIKGTYVKSNATDQMYNYTHLLLNDFKEMIENDKEIGTDNKEKRIKEKYFPINLELRNYKNSSSYSSKSLSIKDKSELEKYIQDLKNPEYSNFKQNKQKFKQIENIDYDFTQK